MSTPDEKIPQGQNYARLRTRWFLIALIAEGLLLMAVVLACRQLLREGDIELPPLILLGRFLPIWLVGAVVYVAVMLPIEYQFLYALRRRFGLALESSHRAIKRIARSLLTRLAWAVAIVTLLLILRVFTGAYWILILAGMLVLWRLGQLSFPRSPKRILGYEVKPAGEDETIDLLRNFAKSQVGGNIEIRVLSTSAIGSEAQAAFCRRRKASYVYLSDNLIKLLSAVELKAIFAHELGHYRLRRRSCRFVMFWLLIVFYLAGELPFYGYGYVSPALAVYVAPLVMLLLYSLTLLIRPVMLMLSRYDERRANALALQMTADPAAFISAMRKLAANNLATSQPGVIEKLLIQTHPSLQEVIRQAERYADKAAD